MVIITLVDFVFAQDFKHAHFVSALSETNKMLKKHMKKCML